MAGLVGIALGLVILVVSRQLAARHVRTRVVKVLEERTSYEQGLAVATMIGAIAIVLGLIDLALEHVPITVELRRRPKLTITP